MTYLTAALPSTQLLLLEADVVVDEGGFKVFRADTPIHFQIKRKKRGDNAAAFESQ